MLAALLTAGGNASLRHTYLKGASMKHTIDIAGLERDLELFRVDDDLCIAAFVLFGDVEMNKHAASELLKRAPEFDIILTAEAKSITLAYEMAAMAAQNDYVVARKGLKVYMGEDVLGVTVKSITTANEQKLYLGENDVAKLKGKRVLIVDDVISTGESLKALQSLATSAGGEVVGSMAVLAEGDAINREDIIVLGQLPLFNAKGEQL